MHHRRTLALFSLALLAGVLVQLWPFFFHDVGGYISAPYQFDYEEGNILNALQRIRHGDTPYPDPHALPSVFNPYGPAAYYTLAVPATIWGIGFVAPRYFILACVAVICFTLARLIRRETRSIVLALAFGILYASLPVVLGWSWLLRVDFLALAFTLLGVAAFPGPEIRDQTEVPGGKKSRLEQYRLFPSAFFFAAALLTKYSLLAAPAACALQLIFERRWRDLARFAAMIAVLCGVVLGAFLIFTRGAILTHLFLSHPDPFHWDVYLLRMTRMIAVHRPLAALAAVYVIAQLVRRQLTVPMLWLLLATAGAVTAGKLGSGWNHFLEWPAALILCAALGLSTLAQLPTRILSFALLSSASAWVLWFALQPNPESDPFRPVSGCAQAYSWVRRDAGPNLLSENVGALVLGGKQVWVSNPFVLNQLVLRAGWSDAELVNMLRERRFDAVLAHSDYASVPAFLADGAERFSPQMLRALKENYSPEPMFQCKDMNIVYRPKSSPAIQSNEGIGF